MVEYMRGRKSYEEGKTHQQLFLLFLCRLVIESTGLNDLVVDNELGLRTSKHRLLDTLLRR